jgi:putative transposase
MILTFKVKHQQDFSTQLRQARQVAKFAIANRDKLSSKYVAHFGLKSAISNQILREYGKNKNCKSIKNIKLIIPNQSIKVDKETKTIELILLKTSFKYEFKQDFKKINQIEIDEHYFYVAVEVQEEEQLKPDGWLGIDRNTTGHCAVASCTKTGKVFMLGKQAKHVHQKYSKIRKKFQRLGKLRKLKTIKHRESNITKDLNHKISRKVVNYAKQNNCGIKLEDLTGIRKTTKQAKSFKYALNSWAYYQLQQFIEYKAQLAGVPVVKIEPAYTSQRCQMCGRLGTRNDKRFKCPYCGYTVHADINASWNIAYSEQLLVGPRSKCRPEFDCIHFGIPYSQRLQLEKDGCKGNTDIPQGALSMKHGQHQNPLCFS